MGFIATILSVFLGIAVLLHKGALWEKLVVSLGMLAAVAMLAATFIADATRT